MAEDFSGFERRALEAATFEAEWLRADAAQKAAELAEMKAMHDRGRAGQVAMRVELGRRGRVCHAAR